jgi:hypothetical protein
MRMYVYTERDSYKKHNNTFSGFLFLGCLLRDNQHRIDIYIYKERKSSSGKRISNEKEEEAHPFDPTRQSYTT